MRRVQYPTVCMWLLKGEGRGGMEGGREGRERGGRGGREGRDDCYTYSDGTAIFI